MIVDPGVASPSLIVSTRTSRLTAYCNAGRTVVFVTSQFRPPRFPKESIRASDATQAPISEKPMASTANFPTLFVPPATLVGIVTYCAVAREEAASMTPARKSLYIPVPMGGMFLYPCRAWGQETPDQTCSGITKKNIERMFDFGCQVGTRSV